MRQLHLTLRYISLQVQGMKGHHDERNILGFI